MYEIKFADPFELREPRTTCSIAGMFLGLGLGRIRTTGSAPATDRLLADNGTDILTTDSGDRLING